MRKSNLSLIDSLAQQQPQGGTAGQVLPALEAEVTESLVGTDVFRSGLAPARSIQDAWPWFVLVASCLFLADVFVRRVTIHFDWLKNLFSKQDQAAMDQQTKSRLESLNQTKQKVGKTRQSQGGLRFEPDVNPSPLDEGEPLTWIAIVRLPLLSTAIAAFDEVYEATAAEP